MMMISVMSSIARAREHRSLGLEARVGDEPSADRDHFALTVSPLRLLRSLKAQYEARRFRPPLASFCHDARLGQSGGAKIAPKTLGFGTQNAQTAAVVETEVVGTSLEAIRAAGQHLLRGDVVALPTETVYGLAAIATDEIAVEKIFSTKERPSFDPLIVHVNAPANSPLAWLEAQAVVDLSPLEELARVRSNALLEAFWPGPLTLVLPVGESIPRIVTSGLDTVALRKPDHPVFDAVLRQVAKPLAAPSANRFGRISPTRAEDVLAELRGRVGLIVDGGASRVGIESTVLRAEPRGDFTLLRAGGTPRAAIEAHVGPLMRPPRDDVSAPGRMTSHYAPTIPLHRLPDRLAAVDESTLAQLANQAASEALGVLLIDATDPATEQRLRRLGPRAHRILTSSGDDHEAARTLFRSMRELEQARVDRIVAEPVPRREGLWPAIAERLEKASTPWPTNSR